MPTFVGIFISKDKMKPTPHKCLGHRVRLAQGGWLIVKCCAWHSRYPRRKDAATGITTYRERTLRQLERSMRGLA